MANPQEMWRDMGLSTKQFLIDGGAPEVGGKNVYGKWLKEETGSQLKRKKEALLPKLEGSAVVRKREGRVKRGGGKAC